MSQFSPALARQSRRLVLIRKWVAKTVFFYITLQTKPIIQDLKNNKGRNENGKEKKTHYLNILFYS